MAGVEDWTIQTVAAWLTQISLSKYAKTFTDLHITGNLLQKLTIYDLQTDFHITDTKDCSILLNAIHNIHSKKPFFHLTYTYKDQKNSFPVNFSGFFLGSGPDCAVFIPDTSEKQCFISFEASSQRFFVSHKGPGRSFMKLPRTIPLEQGMIFCIGHTEIKICRILFNQLGKKLFCELEVSGKKIRIGKGGVSIGKSLNCGVVIEGIDVHGLHAIVGEGFVLECFHDCFEVMREGMMYPMFLGSVLKVGEVEIGFE